MKKQILTILAITLSLAFIGGILAGTTTLDNTQNVCLGTDCEYIEGSTGTITIDNCKDKLNIDVDLGGLTPGNYQLSLQTYSNDKRLDSVNICDNPNAPMIGHLNAYECGSWEDYSFYNFEMDALTTDGIFQKSYEISLPEGYYNVILLVKHDKNPEGTGGSSYPIVLQKGEITFSISNSCTSQYEERLIALEQKVANLQTVTCVNGTNGLDGINGKSAFELWIDQGNSGTIQEFLDSLKGKDGVDGYVVYGVNGTDGYTPIKGIDYFDGVDGTNATVDLTPIDNKLSYFESVINAIFRFIPGFSDYYNSPNVEKEDCTTKANDFFCDYRGFSIRKDYYKCKLGEGTATSCNVGKCSYVSGLTQCKEGCNVNTGKC